VPAELIKGLSAFWYYALQNRIRWANSRSALAELSERAKQQLVELQISDADLSELCRDGVVEVGIPYIHESNWSPRILPWEFLLRAAGNRQDLLIIRHLQIARPTAAHPAKPQRALFVQSCPGWLDGRISFDTEEPLVMGSLQLKGDALANPTLQQLTEWARRKPRPQIIHLTGVDPHQEWALRWRRERRKRKPSETTDPTKPTIRDGLCLSAGSSGTAIEGIEAVDWVTLAPALEPKDAVVSCNFYYSAARVAPTMIVHGARASIGFQDEYDDAFAERFFAGFYQHWRTTQWDLGAAFLRAWTQVSASRQPGEGIVFWTRESLLDLIKADAAKSAGPPAPIAPTKRPKANYSLDIKPSRDVSYALLHNGRGLFERFRFYKFEPNPIDNLEVEVVLYLGTETFPYTGAFTIENDEPLLDLENGINLPLTSQFARSLREDVQSSIRVRVSHRGTELYSETHRVKLLAINTWRFDPDGGERLLASFVLPGDSAVAKVIDSAQRYVAALCDDSSAGFDGYQSPDEVDLQVRALWSALAFDQGLSYINPPPVFTGKSQRLRTPSDVIDGRRGTCIDLALLFAACLEQVGLYPVIFLLWDHAFPGYWRSEESYKAFIEMKEAPEAGLDGQQPDADSMADPELRRRMAFEEVHSLIRKGALVPLETVYLTARRGFADAIQAGLDNLKSSGDFEAMVNIQKERTDGQSPVPVIVWGGAK